MITCICTNTSENKIKEILSQDNGKQSLEDMGVGQCCRSCIDDLNDLLENNHNEGKSND